MKIQEARDLAVKIFGVYCICSFAISIPQVGSFLAYAHTNEMVSSWAVFAVCSLLPLLFYFCLGYVSIFKTKRVLSILWPGPDEKSAEVLSGGPTLSFWIVLIGFFYLIGSLGGILSELWMLGTKKEVWGSYVSFKSLPDLITLILAVVCIAKAKAIGGFLKTKME